MSAATRATSVMEPSSVHGHSRHRNNFHRPRHGSPGSPMTMSALAEALLNDTSRNGTGGGTGSSNGTRSGSASGRVRTTSLTISSSGMPIVPDALLEEPARARPRQCAPKKKGAGRAGWGSIKDEIRLAQRELTDSPDDVDDTHHHDDDNLNGNASSPSGTPSDDVILSLVRPTFDREEVARELRPALEDYLEHGDLREVQLTCRQLTFGPHKSCLPEEALALAIEHNDDACELVSVLLHAMCKADALSAEHICEALDALLARISDLRLDAPDAPLLLGKFIARAVADDCIPGSYVMDHETPEDSHAIAALAKAAALLSVPNAPAHLAHVWGIHCTRCPLQTTVEHINYLLKEYLSSGDKDEAERCLKELGVPHFHHELVYEVVLLALQDGHEPRVQRLALGLLAFLSNSGDISEDQMLTGFRRIYKSIDDIVLDIPRAHVHLEHFVHRSAHMGLIPKALVEELPQRVPSMSAKGAGGRRRYVSENDSTRYHPVA